jgi:hypothetical protein
MEKVTRDGKVAIIYSPGSGAGWFTYNMSHPELIYHPKLVELIEKDKKHLMSEEWMKENLGFDDIYIGGWQDVKLEWLPEGTLFYIDEYDGSESIQTDESLILRA